MGYRFFVPQVFLRVALLLATVTTLAFMVTGTRLYATMFVISGVLIVQTLELARYVSRTNRDLRQFLLAVRHSDFSGSYRGGTTDEDSFGALAAAFDEALERFRVARSEREARIRYLDVVVQHVPIAVIALRNDDTITQLNRAAVRLLGRGDLRDLTSLREIAPQLASAIGEVQAGERRLVNMTREDVPLQLTVHATVVRTDGREEKLVTVQNIRSELAATEFLAWQKLIRVLTHEIVNSLTPIISLAATARDTLNGVAKSQPPEIENAESFEEAREAVDTIVRRSEGLKRFVRSYRELSHLPTPDVKVFSCAELAQRLSRLMVRSLEEQNISLVTHVEPEELEVAADAELVEQALINLIRNAADAVEGVTGATITLSARLGGSGSVRIGVTDNGAGMTEDIRKNLFVPFFTTKRTGSGIGLAVVRQIVRLHHGDITVESEPGRGTTVTLYL